MPASAKRTCHTAHRVRAQDSSAKLQAVGKTQVLPGRTLSNPARSRSAVPRDLDQPDHHYGLARAGERARRSIPRPRRLGTRRRSRSLRCPRHCASKQPDAEPVAAVVPRCWRCCLRARASSTRGEIRVEVAFQHPRAQATSPTSRSVGLIAPRRHRAPSSTFRHAESLWHQAQRPPLDTNSQRKGPKPTLVCRRGFRGAFAATQGECQCDPADGELRPLGSSEPRGGQRPVARAHGSCKALAAQRPAYRFHRGQDTEAHALPASMPARAGSCIQEIPRQGR